MMALDIGMNWTEAMKSALNISDEDKDDIKDNRGCQTEFCKPTTLTDFNYIYAIDGIAILCVAIFGIIGTIMSIIVLLKPHICKRRERLQRSYSTYSSVSHRREQYFSIFLTALCIFDCWFLIMSILYIALPSISGIDNSGIDEFTIENECSKSSLCCW